MVRTHGRSGVSWNGFTRSTRTTRKTRRYDAITEQVLGGYYDVYREHGYGYLEPVYARSLLVELQYRRIPVEREVSTSVIYRGVNVGTYRADLIVAGKVLVEVKASQKLTVADERQVLNYLKAMKLEVALLLNFGPKPEFRRLILSRQ